MTPFQFIEPENLEDACRLLGELGTSAKIMTGGQSLMVLLKQRLVTPDYVIGIKKLQELDYLTADRDRIAIGSLTTHRQLETSPVIEKELPMLVEMERNVASIQIRNWGTIGGNLCIGDPACDPAVALLALEAKVKLRSLRGEREVPLEEFFADYLETALEPDEILVEVVVPRPEAHTQGAYVKESVRAGDYGIATAAVVVSLDGGVIKKARIALGAAGPTPLRAKKAEEAISGRDVDSALEVAGSIAAEEAHPTTDIEGSEAYKRRIIELITKEALAIAVKRVREGSNPGA
jgi:aerobic carbon-monoxide dehydrogenase medium subunit